MRINIFISCAISLIFFLNINDSYCQMAATYSRAEKLCLEAANKYDRLNCIESANYCRKMAAWNHCMVSALAGNTNPCGIEPLPQNAPKCDAATTGGSGSGTSSAATSAGKSDPVKEIQAQQQKTESEINSAQNIAKTTFENSVKSGKKESTSMVDATLAGAQYISDPKMSLVYSAAGLGVAGLMALGEKKEANNLARLQELKTFKESLPTSSTLFSFLRGTTDYHITKLKVIKGSNGRIQNVIRTDLYDISVSLIKISNTEDIITIYESVSFKNLVSSNDSCVISKITIPIQNIKNAVAYNGNYTNSYNYTSNSYDNFRYKVLRNSTVKYAFSMDGEYPTLPSGLSDVYIETKSQSINITKKSFAAKTDKSLLNDQDFNDGYTYSTNSYMLVLEEDSYKVKDIVDYLNYIKIK